jgi:hypothetical protein
MTRNAISRKSYVYADGTTSRSAKTGWTGLRFEVFNGRDADEKPVVINTIDMPRDSFNADILSCAAGHGLMQKIGDELAGYDKKAEKAGAAADHAFVTGLISDAFDNLKSGVWVEEGEGSGGGGNVTVLLEAVVAAYAESGVTLTPEQTAGLMKKLADKAERDGLKANPIVAKHVAIITANRAAERAKAATKAAKGAELPTLFEVKALS